MPILQRTRHSNFFHPLIAVIITFLLCITVMAIYLQGPLQGNFNHFFMPAEQFGIPMELKERGISALYKGSYETGWDGQFYYYISNDPLAKKDTTQHIDSSAYRYQRIGLPLLAKGISKLTGQSWVSPLMYYLTNLFMILIATGVAAVFLQRRNLSPYLILFWALACGTQVTLLHGLPDATADAFLILALISLVQQRPLLYAFTATFAALSREAYVLLPCCMVLVLSIQNLRTDGISLKGLQAFLKQTWPHVIPIVIFGAWQAFIRIKFGVSPSSQASNVLGWPFTSAYHYMMADFHNANPLAGIGKMAYLEGTGIILYLVLLA